MINFSISNLQQLESESIYILREVFAEFEKPVILYSVGKDSSVLLHLAKKAFYPSSIPFPLLHIDTGFKFDEMYEFRDKVAKEENLNLIIYKNTDAISKNINPYDFGTQKCCALLKTESLLQGLKKYNFQAAIGGARRDEEKSRAKERVFSFRDEFGQWDPKMQRPELWNLYNSSIGPGESIRVFPLSNWTELDIWNYIHQEKISIVPLYFAKSRKVIIKNNQIIPVTKVDQVVDSEKVQFMNCRFRTLGCSPCTGAIQSSANTIPEIIQEMMLVKQSERSTRIIDHDAEGSMEKKKREGYF